MIKVFGSKFLEPVQRSENLSAKHWTWTPSAPVSTIYGSGNNTQSRMSTYAAEKDNRDDDDRPNEGLAA